MFGLVERTEPVVLPNTGTWSRGASDGEWHQVVRKKTMQLTVLFLYAPDLELKRIKSMDNLQSLMKENLYRPLPSHAVKPEEPHKQG